jgi:hypothetical protein
VCLLSAVPTRACVMWRAGLLVVYGVFLGGVVIAAYTTISQPQPGTNTQANSQQSANLNQAPPTGKYQPGTGTNKQPTSQPQQGHQQQASNQQASPNKGTGNQAVPTRQSQPGHQQPGNQPTRAPNPGKNARSFVVSCVMMRGWGFGISSGSRVQACAGYINPQSTYYSLVCKSPAYTLLISLYIPTAYYLAAHHLAVYHFTAHYSSVCYSFAVL